MAGKFIKPSEIERIATEVLNKANISSNWEGQIKRVDVDSIIEFTYGLNFEVRNLDSLCDGEHKILAAIYPARKVICFNETQTHLFNDKPGLHNFTEAHELGHWILHANQHENENQPLFEGASILCRGLDGSSNDYKEIQADMFAGALLMPLNIIKHAVNAIKQERRVVFPDLYRMSEEFEVTISALTNRVVKLGLLYVKNGKVYADEPEARGEGTLF